MTPALQTEAFAAPPKAPCERVEIRLALDAMGPQIASVLGDNGIFLEHADWAKVYPSWLIATVGDEVIGCLQVVYSKPVGYLEFLQVRPSASRRARAQAIHKLLAQGFATLQMGGCQYVSAAVSQKNHGFAAIVERKLNAAKMQPCDIYLKRLS